MYLKKKERICGKKITRKAKYIGKKKMKTGIERDQIEMKED